MNSYLDDIAEKFSNHSLHQTSNPNMITPVNIKSRQINRGTLKEMNLTNLFADNTCNNTKTHVKHMSSSFEIDKSLGKWRENRINLKIDKFNQIKQINIQDDNFLDEDVGCEDEEYYSCFYDNTKLENVITPCFSLTPNSTHEKNKSHTDELVSFLIELEQILSRILFYFDNFYVNVNEIVTLLIKTQDYSLIIKHSITSEILDFFYLIDLFSGFCFFLNYLCLKENLDNKNNEQRLFEDFSFIVIIKSLKIMISSIYKNTYALVKSCDLNNKLDLSSVNEKNNSLSLILKISKILNSSKNKDDLDIVIKRINDECLLNAKNILS